MTGTVIINVSSIYIPVILAIIFVIAVILLVMIVIAIVVLIVIMSAIDHRQLFAFLFAGGCATLPKPAFYIGRLAVYFCVWN
jgi:hypothetical protein